MEDSGTHPAAAQQVWPGPQYFVHWILQSIGEITTGVTALFASTTASSAAEATTTAAAFSAIFSLVAD